MAFLTFFPALIDAGRLLLILVNYLQFTTYSGEKLTENGDVLEGY